MTESANVEATSSQENASVAGTGSSEVTVHVRFAPDGTVSEIGFRPAGTTPQAWFVALSRSRPGSFRALTGGRGLFVLPSATLDQARGALPAAHDRKG